MSSPSDFFIIPFEEALPLERRVFSDGSVGLATASARLALQASRLHANEELRRVCVL